MHAGADSLLTEKIKKVIIENYGYQESTLPRQHGLPYSKFINGLNKAEIKVDEKFLQIWLLMILKDLKN